MSTNNFNGVSKGRSLELPMSNLLNTETVEGLRQFTMDLKDQEKKYLESSTLIENMKSEKAGAMSEIRQQQAEIFYTSPIYRKLNKRYVVTVESETIEGVYTEIFTPSRGTSPNNQQRILINLHGGGFTGGSRTNSHLESIPIAAEGGFQVVSIDYRMAPEHRFPAASDDVVNVYKALLQNYKPENIGIYGSSAGGILTAQSIAQLQAKGLPLPGAVGMFCGAAYFWSDGDSGHIGPMLVSYPIPGLEEAPYFKGTDPDDPQVFPGKSVDVLAGFPPSLLIASTRDFALSGVVHTHTQLIKLGVHADLHIWEGLEHTFLYNAELPESREAYRVIVDFFNKHLDTK